MSVDEGGVYRIHFQTSVWGPVEENLSCFLSAQFQNPDTSYPHKVDMALVPSAGKTPKEYIMTYSIEQIDQSKIRMTEDTSLKNNKVTKIYNFTN